MHTLKFINSTNILSLLPSLLQHNTHENNAVNILHDYCPKAFETVD